MKSKRNDQQRLPEIPFQEIIRQVSKDTFLLREIRRLYHEADRAIASAGSICLGGGVCCKFDAAGHRLYATTGELALLATKPPPDPKQYSFMRCPYQVRNRCCAREVRPLGCRSYFCGDSRKDILSSIHEDFHSRLQKLHRDNSIPYLYLELTAAASAVFD